MPDGTRSASHGAWLYEVALRELYRAEARVRMSLRSMKLIDRRCEASSAVPSLVECLIGDLPASDDEGLIDQDLFAELGIEDLVAELHQHLVVDLGDVGIAGVAGAGGI